MLALVELDWKEIIWITSTSVIAGMLIVLMFGTTMLSFFDLLSTVATVFVANIIFSILRR